MSFPGVPFWAGSGHASGISERAVFTVGIHLRLSETFGTFASVFFSECDFLVGECGFLGARGLGEGVGVSSGVDPGVCGLLAVLCKDSCDLDFEADCLEGGRAAGVTVGGTLRLPKGGRETG